LGRIGTEGNEENEGEEFGTGENREVRRGFGWLGTSSTSLQKLKLTTESTEDTGGRE
jgi:hypothetical protein